MAEQRFKRRVGPQGSRNATAALLADTVLSIVEERGLLGGISLTEVADQAEVDRRLVYQYFGDRRELLRAALRSGIDERYREFDTELRPKHPRDRWGRYVKIMVKQLQSIELVTMLHLDRDPRVRLLPIKHRTLPALRLDQEGGYLPKDLAVEGILIAISSFGYGYSLFRSRYAKELGLEPEELDDLVEAVLSHWLSSMDSSTSSADEKDNPGSDGLTPLLGPRSP